MTAMAAMAAMADAVRLVATIRRVGERAGKISDITGIIEAIAFRTNILALNAAVEPAPAGLMGTQVFFPSRQRPACLGLVRRIVYAMLTIAFDL